MNEAQKADALTLFEEALAEFTAEDYKKSDAPYLLLDQADPELRARLVGLMEDDAKAKKIPRTRFQTLYEAHRKNLRLVQEAETETAMTAFRGQPIALRCGDYLMDENSIRAVVQTNTNFINTVMVCPHPILPSRRYVNMETGAESLEISFRREQWRKIVFGKDVLSSANRILELAPYGISVNSETAKNLVTYLARMDDMNRDLIPMTKTASHLGWLETGEGFVPYIDDVVYDNAGKFEQMFSAVRTEGSFEKWREELKKIRHEDRYVPTRIILAASAAAPLVKPLEALPFIVHMWGESGIGKSVALVAAASMWAYPEIGYYVKVLKSTDVALEQSAAFCCHMPLCLDELETIQNRTNFDGIIYSLCEGSSKSRGARTGGLQKTQQWRNSILTNGEKPISGEHSRTGASNRVLNIECVDQMFPDARAAYQTLVHNYGTAGRLIVDALSMPGFVDEVRKVQQGYYSVLSGMGTDKQVLSMSLILTGDWLLDTAVFQDGVRLSIDNVRPYLITQEEVNANGHAYEWLSEWMSANINHFVTDENGGSLNTEVYGRIKTDKENGVIYCSILKNIFDREMQLSGYSPTAFLSWAKRNKKIISSEGHNTVLDRMFSKAPPVRVAKLIFPIDSTDSENKKPGLQQKIDTYIDASDEPLPWTE